MAELLYLIQFCPVIILKELMLDSDTCSVLLLTDLLTLTYRGNRARGKSHLVN